MVVYFGDALTVWCHLNSLGRLVAKDDDDKVVGYSTGDIADMYLLERTQLLRVLNAGVDIGCVCPGSCRPPADNGTMIVRNSQSL